MEKKVVFFLKTILLSGNTSFVSILFVCACFVLLCVHFCFSKLIHKMKGLAKKDIIVLV